MLPSLLLISIVVPISLQSYVEPALTLPPTPDLPLSLATEVGYVNLTDEVHIWHARWGPPPSKDGMDDEAPILFLHGELTNSDWWGNQISFLVDKYPQRTIIAMDSRMQGRSTGWSQSISYYIMMDDVIGLLDNLGIAKATVIGWSDGGIIGQELIVNHPTRVERLLDFAGQITAKDTPPGAYNASTIVQFIPRAYTEFEELSPAPNELNVTIAKVTALKANFTEADFAQVPTLFADCMSAPLIWFVDAADEELVSNGTARQMSNWVPGSGLVLLPSVSHFGMMQDPETFNVVLDRFLSYAINCNGTSRS